MDVHKMVTQLPSLLDEDRAFNINIKRHISCTYSSLNKKTTMWVWLQYLVNHLLLAQDRTWWKSAEKMDFVIFRFFFGWWWAHWDQLLQDHIKWDELIGHQHTMLWNGDKYLEIAVGQNVHCITSCVMHMTSNSPF